MSKSTDFMKRYRKWAKENDQHGSQAFSRFVMLYFLESLTSSTDEFVFKGGNLLWHYIKTPRKTVDLDLSTITSKNHEVVTQQLEKVNEETNTDITYKIKEFKKISKKGSIGAKIIMEYKTSSGQRNRFGLDIVYAIPSDISQVKSTLSKKEIKSASIENIIADKVSAAQTFKSGNTRMKDFDDLWRILKSDKEINREKIVDLFFNRNIQFELNNDWASSMEESWKIHAQDYQDLPADINHVFDEINSWLKEFEKE